MLQHPNEVRTYPGPLTPQGWVKTTIEPRMPYWFIMLLILSHLAVLLIGAAAGFYYQAEMNDAQETVVATNR